MVKAIQIRNVPAAVHRRLVARAAQAGMSLSEFLLAELVELADLPTVDEMQARLRSRKAASSSRSATAAIRKARDSTCGSSSMLPTWRWPTSRERWLRSI